MLWRTYGSCENYGVLNGHKGAILDLHWSRSSANIFSASADTTLASWDLETGLRIRRHEGHEEIVNCLTASPRGEEILVSGSDDGCVGVWDPRVKRAVDFIETDFPITSVAVAEAGNEIYTGGIDCDILAYDIRKKAVAYRMPGHTDTVTSLSISPDSQSLLSYSHDGLARTWDIRPFAPVDRSLRSFAGAPVGVERNLVRACWDVKGERVGVVSGDGSVCVWEARTSKLVYKLPGHRGTVNDVRFAPGNEPISESTPLRPTGILLIDSSCERLIRSKSDTRRIGELALLIKSVFAGSPTRDQKRPEETRKAKTLNALEQMTVRGACSLIQIRFKLEGLFQPYVAIGYQATFRVAANPEIESPHFNRFSRMSATYQAHSSAPILHTLVK